MKIVEIISFENISALEQQILPLPLMRVSMKQLALLLVTMLVTYSIVKINIVLSIIIAIPLLLLTFYKYKSMTFESLFMNMIRYLIRAESNIKNIVSKEKELYNMGLFKSKKKGKIEEGVEVEERIDKPINIKNSYEENKLYYLTPNFSQFQLDMKENTLIKVGDSNIILDDIHKIVLEINEQKITKLIIS